MGIVNQTNFGKDQENNILKAYLKNMKTFPHCQEIKVGQNGKKCQNRKEILRQLDEFFEKAATQTFTPVPGGYVKA